MADVMCQDCGGAPVDRRTFLSRSALGAVALAFAACGGDATAPELNASASIKISDYPALANVNGIATFTVQGSPLAVVRTGATTFIALSRVCPHQGATVGVDGNGFRCPNHGAMFSATGQWTGGERTSNMRSYATSFDAATGTLTIG